LRHHESGFPAGIAGIYNRAVYMDERRRALQAWAKLITGSAVESSNVVSMRAGTADHEEPVSA
jgi:hypothetical protein